MSILKQTLSGLLKPILRAVRIDRVADVAEQFLRIDVSGEDLARARCAPGDKLQVMIDGDFRTYTPFAFDASASRLSLLAFAHGDGPGARWARAARAGDTVYCFGPRGSLPLRDLPSHVVLAGDETSIAVARALGELGRPTTVVLEADRVRAATDAAEAIGLRGASFVPRAPGDTHIAALWSAIRAATPKTSALVLTGKAQTVQQLRRLAARDPLSFAAHKTKAYWAPGKRGLD